MFPLRRSDKGGKIQVAQLHISVIVAEISFGFIYLVIHFICEVVPGLAHQTVK